MPGHSLKRKAKFPAEGASDFRGALKEVKNERHDANTTDLLRKAIIAKRKDKGLDVDMEHLFQTSSVKHELTPAELEKKERRKEQNRRAARKCRQKKKLQQAYVGEDFSKMLNHNKMMEKEIRTLRAEKASLERTLADHLESGSCKNIKVESPGCAVVPSSPAAAQMVMPLSPSPSTSLYLSTASPRVVLDPVSPPAATTTTAHFESDEFNCDAYLQDLGPILPDQTFAEIEMLQDISEMPIDFDELGCPSDTITTGIPHRQTPPPPYHQPVRSEPPRAPYQLPSSSSSSWAAGDPMESLKTLMPPAKACGHHYHHQQPNEIQDRLSVSSVASDLSGWSDRSQGFAVVPTGVGSPLGPVTGRGDGCVASAGHHNHHASSTTTIGGGGSSSSSSEAADDPQETATMGCSPSSQLFWSHGLAAPNSLVTYYGDLGMGGLGDDEEEDDDVFHSGDENIFQQYARKQ